MGRPIWRPAASLDSLRAPDPYGQANKLSSSLQLSAPDEYEGGTVNLIEPRGDFPRVPTPKDKGAVVVFPGWALHEVEPVTAGERWVLLAHGWGPRLR